MHLMTVMDATNTNKKCFTPAEILSSFNKRDKTNNNNNQKFNKQTKISKPKSVNLKDLLSGNKPKSYIVTLKLPQSKRDSYFVTLKLPKPSNNNNNSTPKIHASTSSHPFFKAVYDRINSKQEIEIIDDTENFTESTKQSFVLPNPIKSTLKVTNISPKEKCELDSIYHNKLHLLNLPLKSSNKQIDLSFTDMDFLLFYSIYKENLQQTLNSSNLNYAITVDNNDYDLYIHLISEKYKHLNFDERFNKFFNQAYCNTLNGNTIDQWCDLYKPLNHSQNLQKQYLSTDVYNWLTNAFSKLKKVNRSKRKEKLSSKKKPSNSNNDLDSFIEYTDDENDDSDNLDDADSVPCLIIEGPIGSGKTTMVHSIVDSELDGHVFEFNSSQSRARKELEFHLKQIGTTSMVKKQHQNYDIDKTVILFDDVDLIDENNGDKDFWLGITDLLTYSYRPVILITNDLRSIPSNIVTESSVYKFDNINKTEILAYLDMIALSRRLNLDASILEKLSNFDLRKSIMQLQIFSYNFNLSNVGLTNVTVIDNDSNDNFSNAHNTSNLEILSQFYGRMELDHYTNGLEFDAYSIRNENDIYHQLDNDDIREKFVANRNACVEFYASKYYSNGSRSKMCKYMDGNDYNKRHPANMFYSLPQDKVATDLFGLLRVMAQQEYIRTQCRHPRRFEIHPLDVFDDLYIVHTL